MRYLKGWAPEDAADIARLLDNPNIQDNLRDGLPLPYTEADGAAYIQSTLAAPAGSQYAWAIRQGGRAVGSIAAFRKENIHVRTAEVGYWLGEPYWGRGIGTAALREMCAYLFANTDLLRLYAEPFAHNAGSCRLLEKAGFLCEGTLRKNAVKNGRVIDMKMYALVR